jgi:DNA-directed RNA polymerase subunit M/transcription elongation factor TFIIS
MALVAVLCSNCSHIGFARADALPRVLVCSRCHRKQRFEPPSRRQRLTDREQDLWRRDDIERAAKTEGLG